MNRIKKALIYLLVVSLSAVSAVSATAEINPKGKLNKAQYPWIGELYGSTAGEASGCTAVYIGEQWVLTAAHCVEGKEKLLIKFGGEFTAGGRVTQVDYFVINSKYDDEKNINDIALLHITDKLPYYHVKLPPVDDYALLKKPMYSIGLGLNENNEYTGDLNYTIQNLTFYLNKYSTKIPAIYYDKITKKYSLPCSGDSGGPLVASGKDAILLGITSYGAQYCAPTSPAFYTRVSSYLGWIQASKASMLKEISKTVKSSFQMTQTPQVVVQRSSSGLIVYFTPNKIVNYYSLRCLANSGNSYIYNSNQNAMPLEFPTNIKAVVCSAYYINTSGEESIPAAPFLLKT